jgi:hypothetical protein
VRLEQSSQIQGPNESIAASNQINIVLSYR